MKKIIDGYDNYQIDDTGRVYNINTKTYLKGSIGENGYKYYRLSKNNQKKMFYAHRLVASSFIPNPNKYNIVNHKDGDKLNNSVNNLEWINQSDNVFHAHQNNLISKPSQREYYIDDLENEEWRVIKGFPYSVSNLGRVKNDRTNVLLKPSITCGYYKVRPSIEGKAIDMMIHKIVYMTFHDLASIPNGYVVDHINGNKLDNNLSNLRLITLSENVMAALYDTKTNNSCKPVEQYSLNGEYINTFNSTREAARILNLDASTISKVCRGKNKSHGGFTFKYK